jgi:hypothetical protein
MYRPPLKLQQLVGAILTQLAIVIIWCLISSTSGLCVYDYLLALPQEVRCIWRRKLSMASLLYIFARYFGIIAQGARLIQVVSWNGQHAPNANKVRLRAIWSKINLTRNAYRCWAKASPDLNIMLTLHIGATSHGTSVKYAWLLPMSLSPVSVTALVHVLFGTNWALLLL